MIGRRMASAVRLPFMREVYIMAKTCSICRSKHSEAVTLELLRETPVREIGDKYGFASSTVQRHKQHTKQLPEIVQQQDVVEVKTALLQMRELERRADMIYQQAAEADPKLALQCLKEMRGIARTYAEITGELSKQATVTHQHLHMHQAPEWVSLRGQMLSALQPYPDAREALIKAIGGAVDD